MKITGIKREGSRKGRVILQTDSPVSEELYGVFSDFWEAASVFEVEDGALIYVSEDPPESSLIREASVFLSEAESKLQRDKVSSQNDETNFLNQSSQVSGLPLV